MALCIFSSIVFESRLPFVAPSHVPTPDCCSRYQEISYVRYAGVREDDPHTLRYGTGSLNGSKEKALSARKDQKMSLV